MKIGFSTFTLISNRQDSSSNSAKSTNLGAARVTTQNSERAAAPSISDDLFAKRIKKQQEAFKSLASLPSPKESSQQRAAEKVGFLRQRIEMLKAMMAYASPEQLKNMAKELKSIAGQLAGAAKLLGSDAGGGVGTISIPSVAQVAGADPAALATGDSNDPANAPPEAQVASAEADAKAAEEDAERETKEQAAEQDAEKNAVGLAEGDAAALLASLASITHQNDHSRSKSTGPSASEQALRGALADAQKELREAVNELKIRLREEDKEARRELKKAEKDMEKTDRAIAVSTSNALYSELGQLLPTSLNDVSISTPSINVEV